jgi:acetyl esterase
VRWYWDQYLGDPRVDEPISLVTPARVADLRNAPPAVVVTAGRDPLCDEGVGYARALAAAGVSVRHRHYPDLFHGFLTIPDLPAARSALALLAADLHAICRPVHDRQEQR